MSAPVGQLGPRAAAGARRASAARRARRRARRARRRASSAGAGERVDLAAVGHEVSSPCRDRRRTTPAPWRRRARGGAAPSSCIDANSARYARRSTGGTPGAALEAGRERLAQQLGAGRVGDRGGRARSAVLAARGAADEQRGRLARPQRLGDRARRRRRRPVARPRRGRRRRGSPPSPHETSAGRISVATWPGGPNAAATASAASAPTSSVLADQRMQRRHVARHASRCRTRAARRTACGTSRGRRRC